MKTITYLECENGTRVLSLSEFGKKMDILEKLDIAEFEKKYPDISTYGLDNSLLNVFLEDGTILLQDDWNGYEYISEGKIYRCVYELINDDDWNVVGYYEV